MAAVVTSTTVNKKFVIGSKRMVLATLAFDTGDYAAGGVAVTAAQFGLTAIDALFFQGASLEVAATPTANIPRWNPATSSTGKISLFQTGTAADGPFNEKGAEAFGSGATVAVVVIGH
jgi:hypothetical protein